MLNSALDGIHVDSGSSVQDLGCNTVTGSGRFGIYVNGPVGML